VFWAARGGWKMAGIFFTNRLAVMISVVAVAIMLLKCILNTHTQSSDE
jgi:hypothetical protein